MISSMCCLCTGASALLDRRSKAAAEAERGPAVMYGRSSDGRGPGAEPERSPSTQRPAEGLTGVPPEVRSSEEFVRLQRRVVRWNLYRPADCNREVERAVDARLDALDLDLHGLGTRSPRGPVPTDAVYYNGDQRATAGTADTAALLVATPASLCPPPPATFESARRLMVAPFARFDAAALARWRAEARAAADALPEPPPATSLMPPVVALASTRVQVAGARRRYSSGYSLNRFRASAVVAWVRLSDGVILACATGSAVAGPSYAPSTISMDALNEENESSQEDASDRAHAAMLGALRRMHLTR